MTREQMTYIVAHASTGEQDRANTRQIGMRYVIKGLFYIAILAALGVIGYAYLGDMTPDQAEMTEPVVLDVD